MSVDRQAQLSVVEDLRQPGVRRVVRRVLDLGGTATTAARLAGDGFVDADLVVEAVGDDVVVSGTLRTPWEGACRRCLGEVQGDLEVPVREVFERRPTEGETYQLGDGIVDLGPMVREAVLLALPLAPLCSPDCAGPDPERFPARPAGGADGVADGVADGGDGGESPARDPRWAVLDELRFDPPGSTEEPDPG